MRIKVERMPPRIKEACIARGHDPLKELTIQFAISEYTAWELGDSSWGRTIYDDIKAMENSKIPE